MMPATPHKPQLPAGKGSYVRSVQQFFDANKPTNTAHYAFLGLFLAGGWYLWAIMFANGSGDDMNIAMFAHKFFDGTPLRTTYFGIPVLDSWLLLVTTFEYPATTPQDMSSFWLGFDITAIVQTSILFLYVDNLRKGRTSKVLGSPLFWGLFANGMGAGMVLPLYFFFSIQSNPRPIDQYIDVWEASGLPVAMGVGAVATLILEWSWPAVDRSVALQQWLIGLRVMTPFWVAGLRIAVGRLYDIRNLDVRHRRVLYYPFVQSAYKLTGAVAALSHLLVLSQIALGKQTYAGIFWPDSSIAFAAERETQYLLQEAFRLFLQYDFILMSGAISLWCYFLIAQLPAPTLEKSKLALGIALGNALVGPGATACACLHYREAKLLQAGVKAKEARAQ